MHGAMYDGLVEDLHTAWLRGCRCRLRTGWLPSSNIFQNVVPHVVPPGGAH
jgi:hypothetical protein